jgi:hypothetical protein
VSAILLEIWVVTFFPFRRKSRFAKMLVCLGEEGGDV